MNSPISPMENNDLAQREILRPYEPCEERGMVVGCLADFPTYWAKQAGRDGLGGLLSGFGHSVLSHLDGLGAIPGMALAPRSSVEPGRRGVDFGLFDGASRELGASRESALTAVKFADVAGWAPSFDEDEAGADLLLGPLKFAEIRWELHAKRCNLSDREAIEGFALSLAAILEGVPGCGEGFFMAAAPHKDDKAFHQGNGERWHEPLAEDDAAMLADVGGSLHLSWSRRWRAGSPMDARARAALASREERSGLEASLPVAPANKARPRM